MKQKTLLVLLVIVLVIVFSGSALILANFSAMRSNIAQNSSVASSNGGDETALNRSPDKTGLFVEGESKLAAALHQALTKKLSGQVVTGEIVAVDGTSDKLDYPLLFVSIDQPNITWTPVNARAEVNVSIFYSTDGDVSFRHSQPPGFKMTTDQPTLKMDGTYSFTDESWGLISNPGYVNYLAGEIAKAIATNIQNGK